VAAGARAAGAAGSRSTERDWWVRLLVVLSAPSALFPLLRDDSDEAADARQQPVLVVVFLAGIAGVLTAPVVGTLADPPNGSLLVVAAWAIFAGALYGLAGLFSVGFLLYVATRRLGGRGSYRRARHVLAFALVPAALSLLIVWPARLALYGGDVFRTGGSDHGSGPGALHALELGFLAWSLVLLFLGVRAVHGWTAVRAAAGFGLALALPALVVLAGVLQ
jgi:hypothetical protein